MKRLLVSNVMGVRVFQACVLAVGVSFFAGCSGSASNSPAPPVITPAGGVYLTVQTVSIASPGFGTTIYYTTDGSIPTTSSQIFGGPITFTGVPGPFIVYQNETVNAIAVGPNGTSNVTSNTYMLNLPATPTPTITPAVGGTFTGSESVTIADTLPNTTIYYTTDGSKPTTSSTVYNGPLTLLANATVNAIASGPYTAGAGTGPSTVASAPFVIQAFTPVISPAAGTYTAAQNVTITDTTPGAAIHYTLDGSTPTASSLVYSGALTVAQSETVQAIATSAQNTTSAVASAAYSIKYPTATPSISPAGGTYTAVQTATITDPTAGAVIYYTVDGSTPTTSSAVYTTPVSVLQSETVQAIALAPNFSNSAVASANFTLNIPIVATPTFSPVAGTYNSTQTVTISDTLSGAAIHYTLDGSTPTASSPVYSGAITVSSSTTINAIGTFTGDNPSPVATATYYITTGDTSFTGTVKSGTVPIYDATVRLYAAGTTGYGAGAVLLASTTTNTSGQFTFTKLANFGTGNEGTTANWSCPGTEPAIDPQIYITTSGGNTQGTGVAATTNTAAAFMAAIGPCSKVTAATTPQLNELTTVATVFALAQYINPGSAGGLTVGTDTANTVAYTGSAATPAQAASVQGAIGLNNAVAGIVNLANVNAGTAVTSNSYTGAAGLNVSSVTVTATPESAKLTTIANALGSCINSASSATNACADLLASASPPPIASVTSQPSGTFSTAQDTLQATYYMAVNPIDAGASTSCSTNSNATTKLSCLYSLGTTTPPTPTYSGGLTAAPTDWTIGVTYSSTSTCAPGGAFMNAVYRESVDAYGNVWYMPLNSHTGALSAISPIGAPIFCGKGTIITTTNYSTGFATGLTIDTAGDVWAAWGTNIASTTAGQIYEVVSPGAVPSAASMTLSLYDSAILGSGTYSPTALVGDAYGNVFYSTNSGAQNPATVGTFVYEIPAGTTNTSTAPVSFLVGSDVAATGLFAEGVADSVGRVYFVTNSYSNGIFELTPPSAGITGYSIAGGTVTFNTSVNTFTPGQKVILSGLTSAAGLQLSHQQLTVTGVPTTTSFTATTSVPSTSGTVTDAGTAVVVPTTFGASAYTAVVNNLGNYKVYGGSVDNNNYLYAGYECCAAASPYDTLAKVTINPAGTAITSQTGNYSLSGQNLGGLVGVRSTVLDGAGNVWFGNYAPSVDTTNGAAENVNTGIWSVGELATSGGGSTATFTALSPAAGTLPTGDTCVSNSNATTGVSGCPVGGGFQKAAFETTEGLAIDPSGNVWVGGFGTPFVQTAPSSPAPLTSITEIIGAGVPVATPLSLAAATGKLATKP